MNTDELRRFYEDSGVPSDNSVLPIVHRLALTGWAGPLLPSSVSMIGFLRFFNVDFLRSRASLAAENLALRHKLGVLQRSAKRPRFLIRDRDGAYGDVVRERVRGLGIEEMLIAPHSPCRNPFAEPVVSEYSSAP